MLVASPTESSSPPLERLALEPSEEVQALELEPHRPVGERPRQLALVEQELECLPVLERLVWGPSEPEQEQHPLVLAVERLLELQGRHLHRALPLA